MRVDVGVAGSLKVDGCVCGREREGEIDGARGMERGRKRGNGGGGWGQSCAMKGRRGKVRGANTHFVVLRTRWDGGRMGNVEVEGEETRC